MTTNSSIEPFVVVTTPVSGVCVLTLNRPKTLNALSPAFASALHECVKDAEKDDSIRCVVLTGNGKGFCSGADLGPSGVEQSQTATSQNTLKAGASVAFNMERAYNPMAEALYTLKKPLVIAVNGVAAGGGVGLALLGDIVIANESARFVQVFAPKLGLAPDLGTTWMLPRLVTRARGMALALLGDAIHAKQAAEIGLIWKCVPDDELMKQALELAARLAAGPTLAFHQTRLLMDRSWRKTLPEQLEEERLAQAFLGDTPDFAVGVRAFRKKSTGAGAGGDRPAFTGRKLSKM